MGHMRKDKARRSCTMHERVAILLGVTCKVGRYQDLQKRADHGHSCHWLPKRLLEISAAMTFISLLLLCTVSYKFEQHHCPERR